MNDTIKTYKIANKKRGQVTYGSQAGGLWLFKAGKWTKMTKVRGGQPVAERIAEAIHKSFIRTAGNIVKDDSERIDGVCRNTIDRLLKFRTLADYKPERDWWSNAQVSIPTVALVSPPPLAPLPKVRPFSISDLTEIPDLSLAPIVNRELVPA